MPFLQLVGGGWEIVILLNPPFQFVVSQEELLSIISLNTLEYQSQNAACQ